jgi:hypothetical protein
MAGGSEFTIVGEGDAPGGARWQVMAGGTAEDYLHSWKVIEPDGTWDGIAVEGPALPSDGRLAEVYSGVKNIGRPDQEPLRVHVRADPRVRRLHLVSRDGDECDALPVADDDEVPPPVPHGESCDRRRCPVSGSLTLRIPLVT